MRLLLLLLLLLFGGVRAAATRCRVLNQRYSLPRGQNINSLAEGRNDDKRFM